MASSNLLGKMRFIVKQAGSGSERLGTISGLTRLPGVQIETPTAALSTKGGSVAHLTADVLSWVFTEPQLLWLPLASTLNLEKGARAQGDGVAKFVGLPNHVHCAALNDINETVPGGHFEGDTVPLWTRNGKKKISADRYMDIMEVLKPDIVLAIADGRLSLNENHKRISKSVFRTCSMLEKCISRFKTSGTLHESALIGVIVGASRDKECADCLRQVLLHKESLSGVALSGLTEGAHEAVDIEQLVPIFKNIGESLPKDLLRVVEGCWNPAVVVAAVELGWDVFDGSYPAKLTNAGQALRLLFGEWKSDGTACILDLNDKRYKEDFSPILDDCQCLACRKHSRAYIHHLLNTRELLATVLLSMHNLHHFDQMFKHARNHISANTFQIFKSSITHQYEAYREKQLLIDRHKDLNSVQETVPETETNKKKRMMNGDTSKTEELKNS